MHIRIRTPLPNGDPVLINAEKNASGRQYFLLGSNPMIGKDNAG
jgi:hypothetical protein